MKTSFHPIAWLAVVALLALASPLRADSIDEATREARAIAVLDTLDEGRGEDAREHFNARMREALDATE